jgi:hypothetical protein
MKLESQGSTLHFGALALRQEGTKLHFTYRQEPESDQAVYVDEQFIGGSVHGEFPHNYLPHLANHTDQEGNCKSSLFHTVKAALDRFKGRHNPVFRNGLAALERRQTLLEVKADARARTISGAIDLAG